MAAPGNLFCHKAFFFGVFPCNVTAMSYNTKVQLNGRVDARVFAVCLRFRRGPRTSTSETGSCSPGERGFLPACVRRIPLAA